MCVTCLHENDTVYTSLTSLACTMLFTLGRREKAEGVGEGEGEGEVYKYGRLYLYVLFIIT